MGKVSRGIGFQPVTNRYPVSHRSQARSLCHCFTAHRLEAYATLGRLSPSFDPCFSHECGYPICPPPRPGVGHLFGHRTSKLKCGRLNARLGSRETSSPDRVHMLHLVAVDFRGCNSQLLLDSRTWNPLPLPAYLFFSWMREQKRVKT